MGTSVHIELRVAQIISTQNRREIYNAIVDQPGPFALIDVLHTLQKRGSKLKPTAILNVVKSLHYAGFLSEEAEQLAVRHEGRPRNIYKIVADISAI